MNRTDRLYAIVEELRAAGTAGRTASALALRFEVAPRTIKRDISALQQAGTAIWATAGPGGGYVLDVAVTLPPLAFTAAEATAIAIALAAHADRPYGPEGRSALTKVLGAMHPEARAEADRLAARVWVRLDQVGLERTPVARVIDEALRREVVVVLDYVDVAGHETERRPVEPMLFAKSFEHWYLLAWCRRRRAGRSFRLDRIAGAHLTTERVLQRAVDEVFGPPPADAVPIALD